MLYIYLIVLKVKASAKKRPSLVQTQARRRTPFTVVSFINHNTRQLSAASVCWHHGSSFKYCCTVFQIL